MLFRLVLRCALDPKFSVLHKRNAGQLFNHPVLSISLANKKLIHTNETEEHEHEEGNAANELDLKLALNTEDPLIKRIQSCDKVDDFLKLSNEVKTKDQIVQLLLFYGTVRNKHEPTVLKNTDDFLNRIDAVLPQMNDLELAVSLLYLRLLSVNTKDERIQKMINRLMKSSKEKGVQMNLQAISIFTEFLLLDRSIYAKLLMTELLPVVYEKLENCDNSEDCYSLACCINNIHPVISFDAMQDLKDKINVLMDRKIISENDPKVVYKVINFACFPHWSFKNGQLIQRLLLELKNSIPKMDQRELLQINRTIFVQYEPASLIPLIRDRAHVLLKETKDIDLLQIVCMYSSPDDREKYVLLLKDKVLSHQTKLGPSSDNLTVFFKILRLLKISDMELCDCFWTKIVNKIFSLREVDLKHRVPKYFQRYMNFNNNLGGTYRHIEFEKIVNEYCLVEMRTTSSYLPKDFVKFASFVIAYSDQYDSIPEFIIEKIITHQEQYDIFDCKQLSRALEILHGLKLKKKNNSKLLESQIEILIYVLDNCAKRHIKDPNLHVKEMNTILASFVKRRAPRDSLLFYEILKWYEKSELDLNSRTIREICHSLQIAKFACDSLCDKFFKYIVDNADSVMGETVEKVLSTSYALSYFPENPEALDCCCEIIHRDFNIMSGLSIVQALLALTFYKNVPFELVSRVFQGDFIRKLEQEVQMAYRLETYPQRVMTLIMQLNRAICLDCPEFNIRWFQQNFIEAQMSKRPPLRNKFQQDVHNLLLNIVPSREYLAVNRVTPYGYRVDFEIHVDENYTNKFLKPNATYYETSIFKPKVSKIAILLLNFDTFCFNDVNRLRGEELMRMRHLEMLNYKVIHVKKSDFNILYENITAKIKHMKKLLQISTA